MKRRIQSIILVLSLFVASIVIINYSRTTVLADDTSDITVTDDNPNNPDYAAQTTLYISLDRINSTTSVRCYLHYSGPYVATYVRYGLISFYSSNLLVNTLFDTIDGGYSSYNFNPSGTTTSKYLGLIYVPTNETSVRVSCGTIVIGTLTDEYGHSLSSSYVQIY